MYGLPTIPKGQFRKKSQKGGQMEVKVEAKQVVKIRNLRMRNFAGCEISQPIEFAKFCKLRKFTTLQNFYSGPNSFSLWLQFPSDL